MLLSPYLTRTAVGNTGCSQTYPRLTWEHSGTGLSAGTTRLSGRPGDPRQYLLGHVHGTATEPMESGAPCPTTEGDPDGGTLYFEDGHTVMHGPALLWSLIGPGCRLVQRGRAGDSESLYGACPTMSAALGGSPWSLESRVRLLQFIQMG